MSAGMVAEPEGAGAPGNWLAHEIRRFQENSQGLFPTPKPGEHRTRFNTIYDIEYIPLDKASILLSTLVSKRCHSPTPC